MKIAAANGLARILSAEGTSWVTTFPVCCVNNALAQEGLPLLMMRDERYAVAVADAYSRITGGTHIGVCTVMGGLNAAGLQMAYGALAQAYEDSSPVLCITDGLPPGLGGLPRYDLAAGVSAVSKWFGYIDQPQRVPEVMRRAYTALRSGRPGPVVVAIPRDVGEYDEEKYPYAPVKGWRSAPDPEDVVSAITTLLAAKRPLLYVGEGVFYAHATEALRQLAELVQAPVLTSLKAKSAFSEDHPLSLGVRGELAIDFLRRCDLVFGIGTSLAVGHFRHVIPDARHKTIIQCTNDVEDVNRYYRADGAVVGDAGLTLKALIDEASRRTGGGVRPNEELQAEIRAGKTAMMARYRPLMEADDVPINPYRVYGELIKVLDPRASFLTHDSGSTRDQLSTVYEAVNPRGFLGWGNVSTLGFGLAAAAAAKLAHPDWQCVNVTGDAGVGYMLGNLESLVREGIGVTTVHVNNGGFAGYGPGFWGPGHDPHTWRVSDHTVCDLSSAAKAIGCYGERVMQPAEVGPALRRALDENAKGRPAYLEIICSQYPVFGAWCTG